jgi:hypothetical protein
MPRSWIAVLSGPVMALALITGCTAAGPASEEPESTSAANETLADETSADGSTGESSPQEETGGAEQTGATEAEGAIVTPSLPIGGNSPDSEDAEQCAQASFLGDGENSIPSGVSIVVTGPVFATGVFEVGGDGCADFDGPPCLDSFIFTKDNTGQCTVPVRTDATRPSNDDDDNNQPPQDQLSLAGRLECPDDQEADCRDLARRLANDNQTIRLFAPIEETTETTTGSTETTESTETSESTSESETSESTSETTTSSEDGG